MFRFLTSLLLILSTTAAAPAKERRIVVAVIDTGVDLNLPHLCHQGHRSFTSSSVKDQHGHGTHVASLIAQYAGDADFCIVALKYYEESASGLENQKHMIEALEYAVNIGADIINISGGGPEANPYEHQLIERALNRGARVVAAAGNDNRNLDNDCYYYPACYDARIVTVGNLSDSNILVNFKSPSSNYGHYIKRWEVGTNVKGALPGSRHGYLTGTSQATAIATGKLVKERHELMRGKHEKLRCPFPGLPNGVCPSQPFSPQRTE